jgi:hypothetical protein
MKDAIWKVDNNVFFFSMQVQDLQQRKCTIMFELSCNLERILDFFTQELPMAFLQGPEMNLTRLCELIVFVLSHTTCSADALYFDRYASCWCPHPRSSCSAFFLLGYMLRRELRDLGVTLLRNGCRKSRSWPDR